MCKPKVWIVRVRESYQQTWYNRFERCRLGSASKEEKGCEIQPAPTKREDEDGNLEN